MHDRDPSTDTDQWAPTEQPPPGLLLRCHDGAFERYDGDEPTPEQLDALAMFGLLALGKEPRL